MLNQFRLFQLQVIIFSLFQFLIYSFDNLHIVQPTKGTFSIFVLVSGCTLDNHHDGQKPELSIITSFERLFLMCVSLKV